VRFKRETEFQDTEIGKIPKEWKVVKLKDIATKIKMGGTPKRTVKEYWNGEILFAKIEDITNSGKYLLSTSSTITRLGLENSNAWLVPMNSLLITIYGTLGMVIINKIEVATNQAIVGVIPKRELVDVEFLYYWYLYYQPNWIKFVKKSTQPNLTLEIVANSKLPLPSLAEQKVIAEILSTVDRAIEVVDAGVVRLEGLKKALMRELLTGRIRVREENGKPVFHREIEFQETEIGKIPKEWRVVKLKQVAEIRGTKKAPVSVESVVFIPMEAVPDNRLYVSYEIRDSSEVKSYVYCEPGDILLAKITPSFENGKQGIVPDNIPGKFALATTEVYPIKCNNIDKLFLFYLLKYPPIRSKLASLMRGTTGRRRVPREALENTSLPHPPIYEQKVIAEILSTVDRAIELYREERVRLDRLKRGLMDLLLTGKIRVVED
jgi:type I restriction enzyme S subunit